MLLTDPGLVRVPLLRVVASRAAGERLGAAGPPSRAQGAQKLLVRWKPNG